MRTLNDNELDIIVENYRQPFVSGEIKSAIAKPLIAFKDFPIVQRGEITLTFGGTKTRRSAFNNLLASIALGFKAPGFGTNPNDQNLRVLLIDTNHSRNDSIRMLSFISKRVGNRVDDCSCYNLSAKKASVEFVKAILKKAESEGKPFDIVILDEVGDFSDNGHENIWQFAADLWAIAKRSQCAFIATAYDSWWPDPKNPQKVFWPGEALYKSANAIIQLTLNSKHLTELKYISCFGDYLSLPTAIGNDESGLPVFI